MLRDTGCSGVVVNKELVSNEQFTGDFNCMLLIDNTVRKVPIARIIVNTRYLSGEVKAQCLPDAIYELIIDNVPGASPADDPDSTRQETCAVTTRSQVKEKDEHTPLKVPSSKENAVVDRDALIKMQQ